MKLTSMWQLGHDSMQDWCNVLKTNPALFKMMITKKGLMKIMMMKIIMMIINMMIMILWATGRCNGYHLVTTPAMP